MPAGRFWTGVEATIARERRAAGISWRRIGRELGRSEGSVSGFLNYRHSIPTQREKTAKPCSVCGAASGEPCKKSKRGNISRGPMKARVHAGRFSR